MRIKELDAFRGIAAMSVVMYHYTERFNDIFNSSSLFNFGYGWLGVPFFFMLSGFVIKLTIDKCKTPKEFLLRRFVRLYPTYWICLSITLAVIFISKLNKVYPFFDIDTIDLMANFTMFHQLLNLDHVDGSYWSLLPELLFYLLMAALLWVKKVENILLYNSVLILICITHYFYPIPIVGRLLDLHYVLLFMIGINFYNLYRENKKPYFHYLIIINLIVGVFLYKAQHPGHSIKFLLICFAFFVVVFYAFIYGKLAFFGRIRPLLFLGIISYPLYLVHQNIGYVIILSLADVSVISRELALIISVGTSILLASAVTFYFEPPLKRIVKKIIK